MGYTTAFVLSGGGNYGSIQVGALRALLERNIMPELIIGTSAGAINAAYFAARPTLQGISELEAIWCKVTKEDIYPGTHLHMLWRMITGQESLFPNQQFYKFLATHFHDPTMTFRQIQKPRLFVTAAYLDTGALHLFGEDPEESIIDAVMASTALPPFSPPWRTADGRLHVDGGSVSDLPLGIALKKGAREIYALHIQEVEAREELLNKRRRTMTEIGHSAVRALLKYQLEADLALVRAQRHVKLHYIPLHCIPDLSFLDFSRSAELIENGYQQTKAYLDALSPPTPQAHPPLSARLKQWMAKLERAWKPKRYVTLSE